MSARTLDAARQDSIKSSASGNLSGRHLGLDISRAPSLQANSSGKHGARRMSNTFHRRNSSAAALPPVDMLAAEASVYKALTDEEKQQLNENGEVTRFVKACNGNQTEVRLHTPLSALAQLQWQGCQPHDEQATEACGCNTARHHLAGAKATASDVQLASPGAAPHTALHNLRWESQGALHARGERHLQRAYADGTSRSCCKMINAVCTAWVLSCMSPAGGA